MATDDHRAIPTSAPALADAAERVRNASQRDTRAGFDIYRSTGGTIALDELNIRLRQAGYQQVSVRSYAHFRSLVQAGYTRYVSINRFDIARASEPYENASGNGRYSYRPADLAVSAIFTKATKAVEATGRSVEVGDVGSLLSFTDPAAVTSLRGLKPQPGGAVSLRYLDAGRTVVARIVEADVQAASAMVEVEFVRIESIAALGAADPLTLVDTALTLVGPPPVVPPTLDELNRRLYHVLELIEGLRALVNRAGESLDRPVYAAPPLVRDLSAAGPTTMAVQVAGEVTRLLPLDLVTSVLAAAATIATTHQAWHDAVSPDGSTSDGSPADGSTSDGSLDDGSPAEPDGVEIAGRARLVDLQVERRRHELTLAQTGAALEAAILDRVGRTVPGSHLTRAEASTLAGVHVLPPLRSLGRLGITALTMAIEPSGS